MTNARILPITYISDRKERLVVALGRRLAKKGFADLSLDEIAEAADLPVKTIFTEFQGLPGLFSAFGESPHFWPTADELLGKDADAFLDLPAERQMALFFQRYLRALLKRPQTLDILAWETLEEHEFAKLLENVRVRTALEFFEHIAEDLPEALDLTPVVLILAVAVHHLALRSRTNRTLGGMDIRDPGDLSRIDRAIERMLFGVFYRGEKRP